MTRSPSTPREQYDAFAEMYDRYFSDKLSAPARGAARSPGVDDVFALAEPPAAVLDCACGSGRLVLGLAQHGYLAQGADISPAMIRIARRHARELQSKARFTVAAFAELPRKVRHRFNLVLCVGNAIGHCRGEREMLAALCGMHAVLKPGGTLHLNTRCWETYRKRRVRFDTFRAKVVEGERLIWLNVRHYPRRFTDSHLIEVVIISEREGATTARSFPVTYYPFRVGDLKRRLRAAGFEDIQTTYQDGAQWYRVTARRAR